MRKWQPNTVNSTESWAPFGAQLFLAPPSSNNGTRKPPPQTPSASHVASTVSAMARRWSRGMASRASRETSMSDARYRHGRLRSRPAPRKKVSGRKHFWGARDRPRFHPTTGQTRLDPPSSSRRRFPASVGSALVSSVFSSSSGVARGGPNRHRQLRPHPRAEETSHAEGIPPTTYVPRLPGLAWGAARASRPRLIIRGESAAGSTAGLRWTKATASG